MKHYYGATPDGRLYWTFTTTGGYEGTSCDLESDNPQCPHAQFLLNNHNKNMHANETLDCIVVYECPCPPETGVCDCPSTKRLSSYCKDGILTDKPTVNILLDGVPTTFGDTLSREPNSLFTIKLAAQDPLAIDDGETAELASQILLEAGSATFTFTNGVSNEITLRAPAQGLTGHLSVTGKMVCHYRLFVKGFSATPA